MTDIVSFGEWVQKRRNQLRYTRKALADLVSCSPVTIKKIERDERRPSAEIAELLATHLQIPDSDKEDFMRRARGKFVPDFISPQEMSLAEAQAPTDEADAPKHNLPPQPTPFFGREKELQDIATSLADANCRLLTILGAGGMGKTRLSIESAQAQLAQFTDGVTYVSLAPVSPASSTEQVNPVAGALADALGISFHGEDTPERQLFAYLRRKEMLIVFDNFEHLVNTAVLISDLLTHAPDIKILVTSRERLNLQQEWLFALQGLSLQEGSSGIITDSEAIQLFMQRAKQVKSSFNVTAELPGIERICQLVEGMPLGLELAAAWVLQLSCEEIAEEIESELDFLTTEMRNVPDRHRSIRAIFGYSWEKLTQKERNVLKNSSVFRGGLGRKAAKEVAGASLPILARLVSKSLLSVGENGRYQIHELLRQFAAERLAIDPAKSAIVQNKHSHFYLNFIEVQSTLLSAMEEESIANIEQEIDNIRTAISYALLHAPDLFTPSVNSSLLLLYEVKGWYLEGKQTTEAITALWESDCQSNPRDEAGRLPPACVSWSAFQITKWWCQWRLGDHHKADEGVQQILQVLPKNDPEHDELRGYALWAYAMTAMIVHGEFSKARSLFEECINLARRIENSDFLSLSLYEYGQLLRQVGEFEEAEKAYTEAHNIRMSLGNQRLLSFSYRSVGLLATKIHGDYAEAERLFKVAYEIQQEKNYPLGIVLNLHTLGIIAQLQGEMVKARDYFQQSIKMANEYNLLYQANLGRWYLGELLIDLGDFEAAKPYFHENVLPIVLTTGGSGWAHLGLNELSEAKTAFHKSLHIMLDSHAKPIGLHALIGMAHLKARSGHFQHALELLVLVQNHKSSTYQIREVARELWDELSAELPSELIAAAEKRGQALDLFETAAALLSESE